MSLDRLAEGPWTFLESTLLEELEASAPASPFQERWLIVPSRHVRDHLLGLIARRLGAVAGLKILLFPDVARAILSGAAGGAPPHLGDLGRALLIRLILREWKDAITDLIGAGAAVPPAFADAVVKTLNDLREAGIAAGAVRDLARSGRGRSGARLRLVADLYARYVARLEDGGVIDLEGLLRLAARRIGEGAPVPGDRAWIYGFYDLTGGQSEVVDALIGAAPVRLLVPVYPETEAYTGALIESWRSRVAPGGRVVSGEMEPRRLLPLPDLWGEMEGDIGRAEGTPALTVASAPGRGREVDTALRVVAAAWRGGLRAHQTRLVAVNRDTYRRTVRLESASAGFDRADGIAVRFLLALLDLTDFGLDVEKIGRALVAFRALSGRPAPGVMGISPLRVVRGGGDLASWTAALRRQATLEIESAGRIEERAEKDADESPIRLQARVQRHRSRAETLEGTAAELETLQPLLGRLPGTAVWGEWADLLEELVGEIAGEEGAAGLREVLDPIRRLERVEARADRDTVRWALQRTMRDMAPDSLLTVHDVMALRGTRSPLLVVMGMAERSWPRRPEQDPLLLDGERKALSGDRDWLLPTSGHRAGEDRLLFRLLVEAGDRVLFLYPRLDEQGNVGRASPLLADWMRRLSGEALDPARIEAMTRAGTRTLGSATLLPGEPVLGGLDRDMAAVGAAIARGDREELYALWESVTFRAGWRAETARWHEGPGPYSGFLTDEGVRALAAALIGMRDGGAVSATLLQEYATCPWRVFLGRVLGIPGEEETRQGRLDPLEMGEVLHDLLHEYVDTARAEGRWPPGPDQAADDQPRLASMAQRRVESAYRRRGQSQPALAAADSRSVVERLTGWLLWESLGNGEEGGAAPLTAGAASGWAAVELERAFHTELELAGRTLHLKGRWDRVDRDASGRLRVLDYKTGGSGPADPADLQGGVNIQMLLYLLAAEGVLGGQGDVAGGLFLHLDPERPYRGPGCRAGGEDLTREGRPRLAALVGALLESIEGGVFLRLPHERKRDSRSELCAGCPAPTICRGWRLGESLRQVESPLLKPLHTARKIAGIAGGKR